MKRSATLALLAAGIGLGSIASIAVTSLHAEATHTTSVTTSTAPAMPGPGRQHGPVQRLDNMASLLGMTTTEFQTAMQSGKPFYQIATEHGVTFDKLKASEETKYKVTLDDMVKVGYITQSQADTFLKNWQTRTAEDPMIGLGMGMGGGPHGGFMR